MIKLAHNKPYYNVTTTGSLVIKSLLYVSLTTFIWYLEGRKKVEKIEKIQWIDIFQPTI